MANQHDIARLERVWRNLDAFTREAIEASIEARVGGLIVGGGLNGALIGGTVAAREVVKNNSGGSIAKGAAVYAAGDDAGTTTVAKARADSIGTMPAVGMMTETVANGALGVMLRVGRLDGFDTSAFAVGDDLYVSASVAGALTATAPATLPQLVASVTVDDATDGTVLVNFGHAYGVGAHAHTLAIDGGNSVNPLFLASQGEFALTNAVPAGLTADVDDWAILGVEAAPVVVAPTAAGWQVRGIAGWATGQILLLWNSSTTAGRYFTLVHQAGTSTASNRFLLPNLGNVDVYPGAGVLLWHDTAGTSRWRPIGAGGPTGAAGGDLSGAYPNPDVVADSHGHTSSTVTTHSTAHAASAVTNTPAGGIAATDVQAAINELDTEKVATASAMVKLAETIVSGSAVASIDFTSIPSTYRHLLIMIVARGDTAATITALNCLVNNDSGANYDRQRLDSNATVATAVEQVGISTATLASIPAASATAGKSGVFAVFISNYAATVFHKYLLSIFGRTQTEAAGGFVTSQILDCWRSTAAINRLTFSAAAGNIDVGSTISIYGIPS